MTHQEIGARVREVIAGRAQQDVAAAVEMTPDAFSRSLNGKRAFTTLELVLVADLVGADVHWLITGERDPMAMSLAARHVTDPLTFERSVPGAEKDNAVLRDVELSYRKVYARPVEPAPLPATPDALREVLGEDFVRCFVERVQDRLGVDVIRVAEISTDYSLTIGGRRVIVLQATGQWYRENYGLAHEVAHLCLDHHSVDETPQQEAEANAFAAELLMPAAQMRAVDWTGAKPFHLAGWLWRYGVSSAALATRLKSLGLPAKRDLALGTERLLRNGGAELDPGLSIASSINRRSEAASRRRFPEQLLVAHREAVESGRELPGTLGWMLGVDPSALQGEVPPLDPQDLADLDDFFGVEG